jgi:toxin ParE1/3/4
MKRKLRLAAAAISDIKSVLDHTLEQFGPLKHKEYKTLIRDALANIAIDPMRPPAKRRAELHPDARTYHVGQRGKRARHLFVYRVIGEELVDVSRLLFDAMNLTKHLPEDFLAEED